MRIPTSADRDVQEAFRELWESIDKVQGRLNVNWKGRRIMNAGNAVDDQDYVTLHDLKKALGESTRNQQARDVLKSTGRPAGTSGVGKNSAPPTVDLADLSDEVDAYAAAHAAELLNSCVREGGSWDYLDGLKAHLEGIDPRVGFNAKRGDDDDPSEDALSYYHGDLGSMVAGSPDVYVIDVISCHCGPEDGESCSPGAAWNNVTTSLAEGGWLPTRPA